MRRDRLVGLEKSEIGRETPNLQARIGFDIPTEALADYRNRELKHPAAVPQRIFSVLAAEKSLMMVCTNI